MNDKMCDVVGNDKRQENNKSGKNMEEKIRV